MFQTLQCKVYTVKLKIYNKHGNGTLREGKMSIKHNKLARTQTLSKARVIDVAIELADEGGIEKLSMRKLGSALGVEAMALYYHFANKNQLIEGMIDRVHGEIEIPLSALDWRDFMRRRALSALEVVARHAWASTLMEAGLAPGPSTLKDREAILKCFREAGFSIEMAVHAITILDIYIYGFAQQYAKLPFSTNEGAAEVSEEVMEQFPVDAYPYLSEMIVEYMMKGNYNALDEFNFGLDLILNGIEEKVSSN